jgi:stearoyl-CoA desaturase (delta-9 desaturase)
MKTANRKWDLNRIFYPFLPISLILSGFAWLAWQRQWSWGWGSLGLLAFFIFDNLGVQLGVHKLMSHRSWQASPFVTRLLAFFAVLSGQGSPLVWVAIHSGIHHKVYDQPQDLHSPIHGKFYAFISWYWRCDTSKINFLNAKEFLRDKMLVFLHDNHLVILMCYWLMLGLWREEAFIYLGLLPAALSITFAGFVNSFLHSTGPITKIIFMKYQNFPSDSTYNSWWLGLVTMGLGLHNNHHHLTQGPYYETRWFEFDPSRLFIPILRSRSLTKNPSQ